MSDYTELQESIDKVIGKIGLTRTKLLLDNFIDNTNVKQNEHEKIKMISQYLTSLAIKVFDLNEKSFFTSYVREYRDARYCCFHLLRKYTNDTFSKTGLFFNCSLRTVIHGYNAAEERLSQPKGNAKFTSNYMLLESKLLDFIGKIN